LDQGQPDSERFDVGLPARMDQAVAGWLMSTYLRLTARVIETHRLADFIDEAERLQQVRVPPLGSRVSIATQLHFGCYTAVYDANTDRAINPRMEALVAFFDRPSRLSLGDEWGSCSPLDFRHSEHVVV
jgi:hypothetical protein